MPKPTQAPIFFQQAIPILRMLDVVKADEFYLGFLGFSIDWEYRFDANAPLYRQISRNGLVLHLSEHHGYGSPGVRVRIMMRGVRELQRELSDKAYRDIRPGLEATAWSTLETGVTDPSGNHICFCERVEAQPKSGPVTLRDYFKLSRQLHGRRARPADSAGPASRARGEPDSRVSRD